MRASRAAAGIALAAAAALTGCATPASDPTAVPTQTVAPSASAPEPTPTAVPVPVAAVGIPPVRVGIAAIDLDEELIDLGLHADGTMEVPTDWDDIGWFTGGGRPGGRGPTVIAAHVDSATGPAAFARLHELGAGDEVVVHDQDGGVWTYVVTGVAEVRKSDFPTADVFGATAGDSLRLITCGGVFDRSVGSYDENLIITASPA